MFKLNQIKQLKNISRVLLINQKNITTTSTCVLNRFLVEQQNSVVPLIKPQCTRRHFGVTQVMEKRLDKKQSSKQDLDSDSEDEEEREFKDDRDSKVVKTNVNSMRADLMLKAGLGIARNKIENIFYESRIRINGKKLSKKSAQVFEGDEIDVIRGFSQTNPSHLVVSRVIVLSAEAREESISVNLRRYKGLLIENYKGSDAFRSSGSTDH